MTEPWQVFIYATICGIVGGVGGAMLLSWFERNGFCRKREP